MVNVTRLQASRNVAARVLAPSVEALDTPLGPHDSHRTPGVCYSALRRLPRRDLHPLERNSVKTAVVCRLRHDAPWRGIIALSNFRLDRIGEATLGEPCEEEPGRTLRDMLAQYGPAAVRLLD